MDLFLPSACAACGRYGPALCGRCIGRFRPATRPDHRFLAPDPGVVVGDALELALAAFTYEGALRRALQRLKYGGASRLAAPLAAAAAPTLARLVALMGRSPLVPVPVHRDRLRERGYNQAALLAATLGRSTRLPVVDVLQRPRATVKQHRLDRGGRLRNLRNAFAVQPGVPLPASVILVDDILTTSATLESCARVLQIAGVERVMGIVIGREA